MESAQAGAVKILAAGPAETAFGADHGATLIADKLLCSWYVRALATHLHDERPL